MHAFPRVYASVAGRPGLSWDKKSDQKKTKKQANVLSSTSESNLHVELNLDNL